MCGPTDIYRKLLGYSLFLTLALFSSLCSGAPPVIENIIHTPYPVTLTDENTTIMADVVDPDGNLDHVYVNITTPSNVTSTYEMGLNSGSTYKYNYSNSTSGVYYYKIWAIDTLNETTSTSTYYFLIANYDWRQENITINVYILATCCAAITEMYVPEYVFLNQTVVFLLFFENCGNIPVNSTITISVLNRMRDTVFMSTGSPWPRGTLDPLESAFYWTIWLAEVPPGNYSMLGIVEYDALRSTLEYIVNDWATFNATANCSARDQNNESICISLGNEECYDISGNVTTVNTTNSTNGTRFENVTVSGINSGTPVYYGNDTFGIYLYNVFVFNMSSCGYYCYACMSADENITQSAECAYVDDTISSANYEVTSIDGNGQNVTLTKMSDNCIYELNETICTVYMNNNTAHCIENLYCYGISRDEEYFQVVTQLGNFTGVRNVTSNITINVTFIQPEYIENITNITEYIENITNITIPERVPGMGLTPGQTQIAIEIEPLKRRLTGFRGYWIPAIFNVTNIGEVPVDNITIYPIVPEGWEYRNATVSYLNISQTVNRTIFVKPPFDADLETYVIPVKAVRGNHTLDIDYYWLTLKEAYNRTLLELVEVLRTITMDANSNVTVPILIRNVGEVELTNIFARLENIELCLDFFGFNTIDSLQPNETQTMLLYLRSKGAPEECKATLIVGSEEGAYAFTDVDIIVLPPPPLLPAPPDLILLIIILMILDGILMAIKKAREGHGRDVTNITRAIYILSSIIVLLMIYVFWVAGYITLPELPSLF